MDINNGLVVQALNYHGQQLTNFVKNLPEFQDLQLSGVDYGLYHSRSNELRREDRGRRLLVHQFITQQFNSLYRYRSFLVIFQDYFQDFQKLCRFFPYTKI